jgi:uncharacterized protein YutE (UPF0331/DUF86 family)
MKKIPLNKRVIIERLDEIEKDVQKLRAFQPLSLEEFRKGENFAIAEHYLRRALEAVLEIGSHVLARIPGARPASYKDIPRLLAEHNIIPADFATKQLTEMVGYRNRLIHFYKEVTIEEMFDIIQQDLDDFDKFSHFIGLLLKNPEEFGLQIE